MPLYFEDVLINNGVTTLKKNEDRDREIVAFPYQITYLDSKTNLELMNDFSGERTGFVQIGPKKWFFPSGYLKEAENFYNFKLKPDDVWIITFPRSGTTWTQELIWLISNDSDYKTAEQIPLTTRFPFLEFSCFVHKDVKREFLEENKLKPEKYKLLQDVDYPARKTLALSKGRRFIKTHLPFSLLPPNLLKAGCKIIYVARNPKDVAVSYYHLNRSFRTQGYKGDFPKYWDYFERNLQAWTPYWEHIKEGWSRRHEKNVLFMFYESMNKNLRGAIQQVANFLNKPCSNEELSRLEEHLKFENFRHNKSVNFQTYKYLGIISEKEEDFVRKGKTGGWRDYFDKELEQRADKWIEENLKDTDLRFPIQKPDVILIH